MHRVQPQPTNNNRIGFHYYPDSVHYRESDLLTWLPELIALGAQWLVLKAPTDRAIPEDFLRSLISAGIEPVIHFRPSLANPPKAGELEVLFDAYANWGVNYICLFDRPNNLTSWSQETWVQQQLIDRYLSIFIPLAEQVCKAGMYPVLSPLEPGGNFWDTAFLKAVLKNIKPGGHARLLDRLVIGAYAWPSNLPLDWGRGGPEVWPGARPYFTPQDEQDHLGFRIFDWYTTIAEVTLGEKIPILLMGTGARLGDQRDLTQPAIDKDTHTIINSKIAGLLARNKPKGGSRDQSAQIPDHILAGCFWLLSAPTGSQVSSDAWYQPDGQTAPAASHFKEQASLRKKKNNLKLENQPEPKDVPSETQSTTQQDTTSSKKLIKHYLLLPKYEWGIADWHLEVAQPYIKKYAPTIGFSLREASLAEKVTIVGGTQSFSPDAVKFLENAGCKITQVSGNGTEIATKLMSI